MPWAFYGSGYWTRSKPLTKKEIRKELGLPRNAPIPANGKKHKSLERKARAKQREKIEKKLREAEEKFWAPHTELVEEIKNLRKKIRQFPCDLAIKDFTLGDWEFMNKILDDLPIERRPNSQNLSSAIKADESDRKKRQTLEKKLDRLMAQSRCKEK